MTTDCNIAGVIIAPLRRHVDARGWLAELFREDSLPDGFRPAMSYISITRPGVARGPHEHREQTDYFFFAGSSLFRVYLWDNRSASPTYGRHCCLEVGENCPTTILIPPGVVHAYKNIGPVDGLTINTPDRLFGGVGKREPVDEIRYEDDPESPFRLSE
ncbi:MAG: dTDP-4-dehydrorhamnose 3,5-epimerase family protein [Candidatus Zixiibacteriota bacterium]|nr:MAG: dTDP-4-dehydrorhamnose 3,5-epimerase family protein [candidate division Zixibacteria bacterium]